MKKNTKESKQEVEETQVEHMMETFPEPRGMPSEWHQHEAAEAKLKAEMKASKEKSKAKASAAASEKAAKDAEKEAHLMEKFPKPQGMPDDWHCTHCEDDETKS